MPRFNRDLLNGLIAGDLGLLRELIELYQADWPMIMGQIRQALSRNDAGKVELMAHRLKGMVRNFFADSVAELAGAIEDMGRRKSLGEVGPRLENLERELEALEREMVDDLRARTP